MVHTITVTLADKLFFVKVVFNQSVLIKQTLPAMLNTETDESDTRQ